MSEVLNIYQKLAKIRKPVEVVKKNRKGYGYTYVDEEEILSKITGLMGKYGVSLIPNITHGSAVVEPYHSRSSSIVSISLSCVSTRPLLSMYLSLTITMSTINAKLAMK